MAAVQFIRFPDGGFVLHKVMIGDVKFSAWYTKEGKLIDCERFSRNGMTTSAVAMRQVNIRAELVRIGSRYVEA
jgi:hypothetical protein